MKTTSRNSFHPVSVILTVFVLCSSATAGENPLTSLWPFGKDKVPLPSFAIPGTGPKKSSDKSTGKSLLAGPSRMLNSAEKQTGALFNRTKNGFQNVSRSLSPFGKKKKSGQKKSLFDRMMPQPSKESNPATVGEFLQMKRPGF